MVLAGECVLGRTPADEGRQLAQHASGRAVGHETKEAKGDQQGVKRRDLQVLQVLEGQVDGRITVGMVGNRVAESAPGFETRADVTETDDVVTGGNAREQGHRHQKDGGQPLCSGAWGCAATALGHKYGSHGAHRHAEPDQIENSNQLTGIIAVRARLVDKA